MRPSDLGLTVHGDAWRRGQWETIQAIALSPKPYVLLEGPPGSGKSLIARAVAALLDMRRSHYLTGTIQLQEQYERDGVVRAVGRPNFQCAIEPIGADAAICTVGGKCEHAGSKGTPGCPYYDQKRTAERAKESVYNYVFWLRQINYAGYIKPDFLVADEAHTLKDHVRSFTEVAVLRSSLGRLGLLGTPEFPGPDADFNAWRTWAHAQFPYVKRKYRETQKDPPEEGDREGVRYARSVHALYQAVETLAKTEDDDWVIQSNPYGWSFKPVWVHRFVPPLVLVHAKKVLLMSATILSKEVFTQLHGIPESDTEFIRLPSFFDVKRRPLLYRPVERARRGESQRAATDAVRSVLSAHPSERILVHTVSNWLAKEVVEDLRGRDTGRAVFGHGQQDRLDALRRFRDTPGAVLVSPSMHTGVDLPDDLLRVQVILRLPFPDLGDPLVKAQMKNATKDNPLDKGQRAYTFDTAAALIQSYGRIMRSEDDWGTTYLLDPAWKWFRAASRDYLPRWFLDAVSYPDNVVRPWVPATNPDKFLDELLTPAR